MGTRSDLEEFVLADAVAELQHLREAHTELIALVRGMAINDVLSSELITLDTQGRASRDWPVAMGSIVVANLGTASLIVAAATPQNSAPTAGIGVGRIGPGLFQTLNVTGTAVAFYGNPGEQVHVQAFTRPQPPAAGAVGGGAPGAASSLSKAIVRQTGAVTRNIPAGRRSYSVVVIAAASAASPTLDGVALPVGLPVNFGIDVAGDTLPGAQLITVVGDDVLYTETF